MLELAELDLLFRLHRNLLWFVEKRLGATGHPVRKLEEYTALPPKVRKKAHDALASNLGLIDTFVNENPARFSAEELEIVLGWRHQVAGKFYVLRDLKKHTVFLSPTSPPIAYGVTALSDPFDEIIGPQRPILVETTLLPFKDKIVYDSLLMFYSIHFGSGITRGLNKSFAEAKARHGVVTSLPVSDLPLQPKAKRAPRTTTRDDLESALSEILGLIDAFCKEYLNEEYAAVCRKMAEKLARKRPSPLVQGSPAAWASGIVRAVGSVNFLHDKSQTPHLPPPDIDRGFGVSTSTGAAKATAIRKGLNLSAFDPEWTLPSRVANNPLTWMLRVNGVMMDIRYAPRAAQEVAFRQGLIPYIPADRSGK